MISIASADITPNVSSFVGAMAMTSNYKQARTFFGAADAMHHKAPTVVVCVNEMEMRGDWV